MIEVPDRHEGTRQCLRGRSSSAIGSLRRDGVGKGYDPTMAARFNPMINSRPPFENLKARRSIKGEQIAGDACLSRDNRDRRLPAQCAASRTLTSRCQITLLVCALDCHQGPVKPRKFPTGTLVESCFLVA